MAGFARTATAATTPATAPTARILSTPRRAAARPAVPPDYSFEVQGFWKIVYEDASGRVALDVDLRDDVVTLYRPGVRSVAAQRNIEAEITSMGKRVEWL